MRIIKYEQLIWYASVVLLMVIRNDTVHSLQKDHEMLELIIINKLYLTQLGVCFCRCHLAALLSSPCVGNVSMH